MVNAQGDAECGSEVAEEKLADGGVRVQQIVVRGWRKQHVHGMKLLRLVQEAVGWTTPQDVQELFQRGTSLLQQLDKPRGLCKDQCFHLMADGAAQSE